VYPTVPVTVEYRLTDLGLELGATVQVVRQWAYANIGQVQQNRAEFDAARA
jgi:DNA-binding HxlR family transcriptional regulator